MSTTPWRGTLIFAGGIAAIAATAVTRFAGADLPAGAAGTSAGTAGTATTQTRTGTSSGTAAAGSSTPAANPAAASNGQAASSGGAVTIVGSTVQTPFGPVQVSVTFSGSKITNAQALQSPNWHQYSVQINSYAVPVLNQEAVAAGSAQINAVSGATYTSEAYMQSLQAAIDQHK